VRTTQNLVAALGALALCTAGGAARAQDEGKPAAAEGEEPKRAQPETKGGPETRQVSLLQAREVIERLKTMRAQLLLEQEYNKLLEVRVERMELEAKLGGSGKASQAPSSARTSATGHITPPPRLENVGEQLVVKAVTVAPFKEAIVTYRGRVYTVRPGDKLGNIEIRDILDSGVVTAGGGHKTSVMLGQ